MISFRRTTCSANVSYILILSSGALHFSSLHPFSASHDLEIARLCFYIFNFGVSLLWCGISFSSCFVL